MNNNYNIKLKPNKPSTNTRHIQPTTPQHLTPQLHRFSQYNDLPKRISQSYFLPPTRIASQPQLTSELETPSSPAPITKMQIYRNRMSSEFKALHQQHPPDHRSDWQQPKRSKLLDKTMIHEKARIGTQQIYDQELERSKQQWELMVRIKQRWQILKKLNGQKHQLIRSYFLQNR